MKDTIDLTDENVVVEPVRKRRRSLEVEPLFDESFAGSVTIDMAALLNANFAVAAFLISFGGLIGKVKPCILMVHGDGDEIAGPGWGRPGWA